MNEKEKIKQLKSVRRVVLTSLTTLFLITTSLFAKADVQTLVQKSKSQHPRLLLTVEKEKQFKQQLKENGHLKLIFNSIKKQALAIVKKKPVERKMKGIRLLHVSHTCMQRIMKLGLAWRLSGEKIFLERAESEMLAAASFSDWNPSHFLDTAIMTGALGIGYDWFYHGLKKETRQIIKTAIIEKGITPSYDEKGWWIRATNNWSPICHGGLTLGALAIMEDHPDLTTKIIQRALDNVPISMDAYLPDGAYPEGPAYWVFGSTHNVILITALETALGTDFGLSKAPGFLESSDYYQHVQGISGDYFNYADCSGLSKEAPALLWFAKMRQQPSLLWNEKLKIEARLENNQPISPLYLIWYDDISVIPPPEKLHWAGHGNNPVSFHRTGWDENDLYIAIKGGSPSTSHSQMDAGTFIFESDGVRWAKDLGLQDYHDLETKKVKLWDMRQESQRWTIFRYNNASHNTLVVDNKPQVIEGMATIEAHEHTKNFAYSIINLRTVYKKQLSKARRGIAILEDKSVWIRDEFTTADHDSEVRWAMLTSARVKIKSPREALLQEDNKTLGFRVLSPENAKLEIYESETPPQPYDAQNPNTRMIGFKLSVPAKSDAVYHIHLIPGFKKSRFNKTTCLDDWKK